LNLSKSNFTSNYVRALSYQLFEHNGVMKRSSLQQMIQNISKEERSDIRKAGIKVGRYHIFLPKMLKPSAVSLRVKLWKLYFPQDKSYTIPKSGLNFLNNESKKNNKFLLICGFESIGNFYIRVDILERLFIQIIEKSKNNAFEIDSNMINLIGCSKENFFRLLELMEYKSTKNKGVKDKIFIYKPRFVKKEKQKSIKNKLKNNAFSKLSEIRFT
jgi:ATP-dependent RNA helicase SUPV3L1/SUV3